MTWLIQSARHFAWALTLTAAAIPVTAAAKEAGAAFSLPHKVIHLSNGMTVVLMPDDTLPNVGLELFLRGGARQERAGNYGTAHLFEHQLAGSAATHLFSNPANRSLFGSAFRGGGAGTDYDYWNFYKLVSPEGLELALAAIAEQLGPDPARFTATRLSADKDIVASEEKRADLPNNPDLLSHLQQGTFGAGHPYGHAVGGSEREVSAATVSLMQGYARNYGNAGNSVVFIVGNFDAESAKAMVRRRFGSLPKGIAAKASATAIPIRQARHETIGVPYDAGGVFMQWASPGWGTVDGDRLQLLGRILNKRLAKSDSGDGTKVEQWQLAGVVRLSGAASTPADAQATERRLAAAVQRLLGEGPTPAELDAAKAQWKAEYLSALVAPVWRRSRTEIAGRGLMYFNDPDHFQTQIERVAAATPEELRATGRKWLTRGPYVLYAFPEPTKSKGDALAAGAPAASVAPTVPASPARQPRFPSVESSDLANGAKLIVAARPELPLARVTIAFGGGTSGDGPKSAVLAAASLAAIKDAPTAAGTPLSEALMQVGAELESGLDQDFATLSFTLVPEQLGSGLTTVLQAIARPPSQDAFAAALDQVRRDSAESDSNPQAARWNAAVCAIANPCVSGLLDGMPDSPTAKAVSTSDIAAYYGSHFNAANAVVIVSGATTGVPLQDIVGHALPAGSPRPAHLPWLAKAPTEHVMIIDAPGASQAYLALLQLLPQSLAEDPEPAALATLTFRQRLMENLRTAKGWSYEMYPYGNNVGRSGSVFYMNIPIKTEKVADAIREVEAEARRMGTDEVNPGFFTTTKGYLVGDLLRGLTSLDSMNEQILEGQRGSLPADYYRRYLQTTVPDISPADVRTEAQKLFDPDHFVWVVAGDLKTIGPQLDAAKMPYTVVKRH